MSLREEATLLEGVAAYRDASVTLTGDGDPERLAALRVSTGFFELLGTPPESKRHVVFDTGHWPFPRGEFINSHGDADGSVQLVVCLETPPAEYAPVDEETLERLRKLGYVD